MTRKDGIIHRRKLLFPKQPIPANKTWEHIFNTEYLNYSELCYYCFEKQLSYEDWLNQAIQPVKEK